MDCRSPRKAAQHRRLNVIKALWGQISNLDNSNSDIIISLNGKYLSRQIVKGAYRVRSGKISFVEMLLLTSLQNSELKLPLNDSTICYSSIYEMLKIAEIAAHAIPHS